MSTVASILSGKQTNVVTIDEYASVLDAAKLMNKHRIGSVVVTRGMNSIAGIITERDVMAKVVALCKDPANTKVSDTMTSPVLTCAPSTPIDELRRIMREQRIRHMPVFDDRGLAGMVSIGDLNAYETMALTSTVETLEAYISRS